MILHIYHPKELFLKIKTVTINKILPEKILRSINMPFINFEASAKVADKDKFQRNFNFDLLIN